MTTPSGLMARAVLDAVRAAAAVTQPDFILAPPAPQEPTVTITRFRKLPIEVDAIQWTGDNEAEVQAFTDGASYFNALDAEDRANCDDPDATATVYDRLHSTWVLVFTGQHIVRGVKGELYPIAEDVLAETYEPVSEAS